MSNRDGDSPNPTPDDDLDRAAARERVRRGIDQERERRKTPGVDAIRRLAGVDDADEPKVVPGGGGRTREGLRRGQVVATHYRIIDRIARGGTAIVYRAHHMGIDREVAFKLLAPPQTTRNDGNFEARFVREARALAALSHPNIVEIIDFGRLDDGRCYLVMEYLEGLRLTEYYKDPDTSVVERLDSVIDLVEGLAHAHARGIVHRDVKLSNALVVRRGDRMVTKILDFGLARLVDEEEDQEITQEGVTMGSPHFMSPEQARGKLLDPRTDIYSIGVLIWVAFTARYPFSGPTSAATMLQHVTEPVPWLSREETVHPVPEGLCATVRTCLAKDRRDRYASARLLVADLRKARAAAAEGRFDATGVDAPLPPPANVPGPRGHIRLALLGWLLVFTACLWWQEEGVTPPPWTVEYRETRAAHR
ncbi:MAG: serine/threonine protein kinase [Alphaproteobacteria bacterium]|nr:serine/threonine protein kinase [Alphaproteobacteria bacterium]